MILLLNEIFVSIDGEVNRFCQGGFSTFIRLAGCNLHCKYCDTAYAQDRSSGTIWLVEKVIEKVEELNCPKVTITGGEPLLQAKAVLSLVQQLVFWSGCEVTLETNGSLDYSDFCRLQESGRFGLVVDYKLPSSGQEDKMMMEQYVLLGSHDWVKFVILCKEDYWRALEVRKTLASVGLRANIAFSPVYDLLDPRDLISWMRRDEVFEHVNLQLHKIVWPEGEKKEE